MPVNGSETVRVHTVARVEGPIRRLALIMQQEQVGPAWQEI